MPYLHCRIQRNESVVNGYDVPLVFIIMEQHVFHLLSCRILTCIPKPALGNRKVYSRVIYMYMYSAAHKPVVSRMSSCALSSLSFVLAV